MYGRTLRTGRPSRVAAVRRHRCFMLFIWMINWDNCYANLAPATVNHTVGIFGERPE